jgi:ABC-type glycerol-3-phosphate transport system substrate-binding protein
VAKGDIGVFDSKPIGPSGTAFLTQFDCEAWAVFKAAKNGDEAIKFLKFFHQPENYIKYVQTASIHLLPVSTKILDDDRYKAIPAFSKWKFWVDAQNKVIAKDDPRPMLLIKDSDKKLPFVGEVAGSTILVDMVTDVVRNGVAPEAAASRGQQRAEQLITQLGYKKW